MSALEGENQATLKSGYQAFTKSRKLEQEMTSSTTQRKAQASAWEGVGGSSGQIPLQKTTICELCLDSDLKTNYKKCELSCRLAPPCTMMPGLVDSTQAGFQSPPAPHARFFVVVTSCTAQSVGALPVNSRSVYCDRSIGQFGFMRPFLNPLPPSYVPNQKIY